MASMAALDLGMYRQLAPAGEGWTLRRAAPGFAAALVFTLAIVLATRVLGGDRAVQRIALDEIRDVSALNVDDKAQIMAEGLDAQSRNAAIPLAGLPLEQVGGIDLGAAAASGATALRCLTQAVYYEAATEPMQGRRAVAQVVLNRMRHPAYPKSVCGVVYQGSERRTGCQFSFTCDGSLLRGPMAGPWREAHAVAAAALAGYVEQSVGTATHYHADYVLPKWAFQLGKIEQLGRHIFYRFTGNWGRAGAFTGKWTGIERIPALNLAALEARIAADGTVLPAVETFTPGLTVAPHVTDRHASNDVGGRIDTTKAWRLSIPDPTGTGSAYRAAVGEEQAEPKPKLAESLAVADQAKDPVKP